MSVKDWLERLCLSRHYENFAANGYETVDQCYDITSADLDRIGISLPGHKKRILLHLERAKSQSASAAGHVDEKLEVHALPLSPNSLSQLAANSLP
jgi:SAM domain (Sterile alpha motif)